MDPSISFLQAIIAIPIFIILFIQIVYLNTVLENKTVSKQLEINYYNTTITNIVLFSICRCIHHNMWFFAYEKNYYPSVTTGTD